VNDLRELERPGNAGTEHGDLACLDDCLGVVLQWYAVLVKSRHEFVAQSELGRKGIEAFLPSVKRLRRWKDRKKLVEFPLFPGYLFIRILQNPEAFLDALKTRGVVTLISLNPGSPTPVPPDEIDSLRILIESGEEIDIYSHLKEGTRVRLNSGPLKGAEGILKKKEDRYVFLVNIEILGRSLGVRIHADDVEAA
jgi:transcription antitermination factor NusG